VVRPGLPKHVPAAHALEPAKNVLQGDVERVAHMQGAGHVRRRDDDCERFGPDPLRATGAKSARLKPSCRDTAFDRAWIECFVHHRNSIRRTRSPNSPRQTRAMANKRPKSKFAENEARATLLIRAGQSSIVVLNLLVAAHDPLDLGADKALHHGRQIGVKPSFEHRAQHFAGKMDDHITMPCKAARQ
jgi:hypothetical protein